MKQLATYSYGTKVSIVRNPHFWILITIIAALNVLYFNKYNILLNNLNPWLEDFFYWEYVYHVHSVLFFIPLIYATIIFKWLGAFGVLVLSPAITFQYVKSGEIPSLFLFSALAVGVISLVFEWRRREKRLLEEREAERQAYMSDILKAEEDERQRIARELHDDTMQTLVAIAHRAQSGVNNTLTKEDAKWIRDTSLRVTEDVRRISLNLRPSVLDEMGLIPAIRWLVDCFNQEGDINIKFDVQGKERELRQEFDIHIFRIIQEALNNIKRHSNATSAWVTLKFSTGNLAITIHDNGRGFSRPSGNGVLIATGKLGITGMKQRTKLINGTLKIDSGRGNGTTISLKIMTSPQ
jgi:two-component system sensor histidine kinase DegS